MKKFFVILSVFSCFVLLLTSCNILKMTSQAEGISQEQIDQYSVPLQTQTVNITDGEAQGSLQDLTVSVSGTSTGGNTFTLAEYDARVHPEVDSIKESQAYVIQDLPQDFSGTLDVSIKIPDNIYRSVNLDNPDRKNDIILWVGTESYAPSTGGQVFNFVPVMDAEIDPVDQVVTTSYSFESNPVVSAPQENNSTVTEDSRLDSGQEEDVVQYSGDSSNDTNTQTHKIPMPPPISRILPDYWTTTPKNLYFKVTEGYKWDSTTDGNFTYYFKRDTYVGAVIDDIKEAREVMENDLGFILNEPISIYIYNMDSRKYIFFGDESSPDGSYNYNPVTGHTICYHKKLLEGDPGLLKATVGHELMHFGQTIITNGYALADTFPTIDEATAVWFESYLLGDPNWMSAVTDPFFNFVHSPWWFSEGKVAIQYGYGASWFAEDIINQYGVDFVKLAYAKTNQDGTAAWRFGATHVSGFDDFNQIFRGFLSEYMLNPANLSKKLASLASFENINNEKIVTAQPS